MSVRTLQEPHIVKVRKEHVCQGCGKTIYPGEEATLSTYVDGKDIWTFYECNDCQDYFKENCIGCQDFEFCLGENYFVGAIRDCKREQNIRLTTGFLLEA